MNLTDNERQEEKDELETESQELRSCIEQLRSKGNNVTPVDIVGALDTFLERCYAGHLRASIRSNIVIRRVSDDVSEIKGTVQTLCRLLQSKIAMSAVFFGIISVFITCLAVTIEWVGTRPFPGDIVRAIELIRNEHTSTKGAP